MATLVLSAAGAAIGGSVGGTVLGLSTAVIGKAVGATIGSAIDQKIMGSGSRAVERRKHLKRPVTRATGPPLCPIPIRCPWRWLFVRERLRGLVVFGLMVTRYRWKTQRGVCTRATRRKCPIH